MHDCTSNANYRAYLVHGSHQQLSTAVLNTMSIPCGQQAGKAHMLDSQFKSSVPSAVSAAPTVCLSSTQSFFFIPMSLGSLSSSHPTQSLHAFKHLLKAPDFPPGPRRQTGRELCSNTGSCSIMRTHLCCIWGSQRESLDPTIACLHACLYLLRLIELFLLPERQSP